MLIGTIGELTGNKNHVLLIDALKHMRHNAQLILIGSGELEKELQKHIHKKGVENRVWIVDINMNAAEYLAAFDIFALPSHKEGLPYVLLEAGHAALPVVVSNIPGNRDIVTSEVTGIICEKKQRAFADALDRLLNNAQLRNRLGESLRNHTQHTFTRRAMCEELRLLYDVSPSISRSASSRRTKRA